MSTILDVPGSPSQKARAFVSPKAERSTVPPEVPSPEWVNRATNYVYLGRPGVRLRNLKGVPVFILVHGPLDEPQRPPGPRRRHRGQAFGEDTARASAIAAEPLAHAEL